MKANTGRQKSSQTTGGSNMALTAVAFQDHLVRNLSLTDPVKNKPVHRSSKNLKEIKSVVNTGRQRTRRKDDSSVSMGTEEKEYVLDKNQQPLTLAQKLGLVEVPQSLLSDSEWTDAKEKSNRRDDSAQPCVICKEEFGLQQQVLLSCSHVFHRNCLQAFERFTGRKTCPMCRKAQYQTKVIHEGAKMHRVACATKIQAFWRGYVVRTWYRKLRCTVPPKDPRLRKKFYEEKLKLITERLLRSYETQVDAFLAEMDRSITASRDVFQHLEASNLRTISQEEWDVIELKAVERGKTECPICIMPLSPPHCSVGDDAHTTSAALISRRTQSKIGQNVSRESPRDKPCRNCDKHGDAAGEATTNNKMCPIRQMVLLSCTHVFHRVCLEAFEELSLTRICVCPVCRSSYQKKTL